VIGPSVDRVGAVARLPISVAHLVVDGVGARATVDDVVASTAGEGVGARATVDDVVASTAGEHVTAVIAGDRIVAVVACDRDRRSTGQRNSHDAGAKPKRDTSIGRVSAERQIFNPDQCLFGVVAGKESKGIPGMHQSRGKSRSDRGEFAAVANGVCGHASPPIFA
jgi:hypothetical protein